jgi:putative pyruvate formate lyase activating enzyme
MYEPGYLALFKIGELARRSDALEARLAACDLCPRVCGINRLKGQKGFCHSGYLPIVSSFCAHSGEEPPISGTKGSGTIFFGNCTMRCVYCQNYQISQDHHGQESKEIPVFKLAQQMVYLQEQGCHNINLVSPTHFVPQIVGALLEAVPMGLKIPLLYNTGGYDSVEVIKQLEGIINIYLPDLRYASNEYAGIYSQAPDYVERARESIVEMYRQVGNLVLDGEDIAQSGLIVRHLILPQSIAGSEESLEWLAKEISPEITLSIMSQYFPTHRASEFKAINRKISQAEYDKVINTLDRFGLENGWLQGMDAPENYLPDFERDTPFQTD